jgi:hypothetical protein
MILYNAPSSYYSMIARLALLEAGISFTSQKMDIHIAKEQFSNWYMALNPHMTVPTLVDGDQVLTDSREILALAALSAKDQWLDLRPDLKKSIEGIVQNFYTISIEDLTFAKAMSKSSVLHFIFPKILGKIIKTLKAKLTTSPYPEAVRAKIALNEARIEYFTQGSLVDKLNIERKRVGSFLTLLPSPSDFLLGNKISSADIVVCVLLGRLKMIGEDDLLRDRPELVSWFNRMGQSPAFIAADIWQKFQLWRILLRR